MTSVLVLGQPYWGQKIAEALDRPGDGMRAAFVPQRSYARLLARPSRDRVCLLRAGYRIGATTTRGRLFDVYWSALRRMLPNATACHYWLGSDVLHTLEEERAGTLRRTAVASSVDDLHLAVAPWLAAELAEIGIEAVTAIIPERRHVPSAPPPMPGTFRVLTYLAANRFAFYGGETLLEAARHLPDVPFDVVGSSGAPVPDVPANIEWHGWVTDMPRFYANSSVVVRIPRHDGAGGTVIEGLLYARHVIYTHEVPFVRTVSPVTPNALVAELAALRDDHLGGRLEPNLGGRSYALEAFDERRLAAKLVALLRERT